MPSLSCSQYEPSTFTSFHPQVDDDIDQGLSQWEITYTIDRTIDYLCCEKEVLEQQVLQSALDLNLHEQRLDIAIDILRGAPSKTKYRKRSPFVDDAAAALSMVQSRDYSLRWQLRLCHDAINHWVQIKNRTHHTRHSLHQRPNNVTACTSSSAPEHATVPTVSDPQERSMREQGRPLNKRKRTKRTHRPDREYNPDSHATFLPNRPTHATDDQPDRKEGTAVLIPNAAPASISMQNALRHTQSTIGCDSLRAQAWLHERDQRGRFASV